MIALRSARLFPVQVTPVTTWLFTELTDRDGHSGWGEATLAGQEAQVIALAEAMLPGLRAIPDGFQATLPFATLAQAALSSSLMQAARDLAARRAGQSLADHLGGTKTTSIGLYANFNRRTRDRSPKGMAASARDALAAGHTAFKIAPFDEVSPTQDRTAMRAAMEIGLARVTAIRDALGDARLMVDCHWRFDATGAAELIDACAALGLYWIECPMAETPETITAITALRRRANAKGMRLAGLETAILEQGFAPWVAAGAYDVMMPDVKYAGGPDEMLRIAARFAGAGIAFSPHNPSGPVCHAHSMQLCAALGNCDLLEMQFDETPMFDTLSRHVLPRPKNGQADLHGMAPGIGIDLQETAG